MLNLHAEPWMARDSRRPSGDTPFLRLPAQARHAKGQKQRWVEIGDIAVSALLDHVERFRGERKGVLFLCSHGRALPTGNSLRMILHRIGEAIGLKKMPPHRRWILCTKLAFVSDCAAVTGRRIGGTVCKGY
ncbi:MAG TPA: hypothetical protein QGI71_01155 [Dehalococcoidia bacterium]|nr:hypothetical protein [Dehalococcoidia bacterium]